MSDEKRSIKMEGLQDLQSGDAGPALLNAARQLLKDNNITASITQESPLDALVNLLPFEDPTDKVVNE